MPNKNNSGKCPLTPLLIYVAETVDCHTRIKLRAIKAIAQVKRSSQIVLKSRAEISSGLV